MKMYAHDIIKGYLVKNKINFTENYKVKLGIRTLTFDFYIPYGNQCIKHFTAQPADIAIKEYEEACENNNFKFIPLIGKKFNKLYLDEVIAREDDTNEYKFMINQILMEGKITRITCETDSLIRFEISQQSGIDFYTYSICCFNSKLFEVIKSNIGNVVLCKGSFHRNDYFNKKENRFVNSYTITCDKIQRR